MHPESLKNMRRVFDRHFAPHLTAGDRVQVVDIGSFDENGTYRDIFDHPAVSYVGVDMQQGPGVDVVTDDPYAYPLPDGHADIVISGQMLEHCEFFWKSFEEMVRIAKPGGFVALIVPSKGPIHRYPVDCYRFLPDTMPALAKLGGCELVEMWHDEASPWGDLVGVFLKPAPTPKALLAERAEKFGGVEYGEFIASYLDLRESTAHLEVGTMHGSSLASVKCASIAVDPDFQLAFPVIGKKPAALLFQMTSDEFFETYNPADLLRGSLTSAFLDGLHLFEALLKDLINTERHCSRRGVIFLHDCLPLTVDMTTRRHADVSAEGAYPNWWTGDVWKIVPILRKYRPDIRLTFVDCPPTGLVMLTQLNPSDTTLARHYDQIVDEFMQIELTEDTLAQHFASCETRSSVDLLKSLRKEQAD